MKIKGWLALIFLVGFFVAGVAGVSYFNRRAQIKNEARKTPKPSSFQDKEQLPIVLINNHPQYLAEINSSFDLKTQKDLLSGHGKEKITFHLVGSENEVPWDGAPQRGIEKDGQTNLPINTMMAIYKDKSIDYYFYPHSEYYQRLGEEKFSVLSGVISYKILEALTAKDRSYLIEAASSPEVSPQEINKYCLNNPLVMVKKK